MHVATGAPPVDIGAPGVAADDFLPQAANIWRCVSALRSRARHNGAQ